MDRWHRIGVLCAVVLVATACGNSSSYGVGSPLNANSHARTAASGLRFAAALSKGRLSYAVAIANADRMVVSVELDVAFSLAVYDMTKAKPRIAFRKRLGVATYDIHDLAVDEAGTQAWVASADGTVRGFDLRKGEQLASMHLGAAATAVALSPNGTYLVTGSATGVVCLRRRKDLALLQCTTAHTKRVSGLSFGRNNRLVSVSWDGTATLWNVPSLAVVATHKLSGSANAVAYSPQADTIAIAVSGSSPIRTPEIAAQEKRSGVAHDPHAAVVLWNPTTKRVRLCKGHRAPVTSVTFGPSGARLLSASWDRTIRMWATRTCASVTKVPGFHHMVRDVAFGSAGRRVAVAAWTTDLSSNSTIAFDVLYP